MPTKVLYCIFDIHNQGFLRRLPRLAEMDASLSIVAFSRGTQGRRKAENLQRLLDAADIVDLGKQTKGVSLRRIGQFARGWVRALRAALRRPAYDVVVVRNLDMALIALPFLLRRPRPRLVYELLDIHPSAWSSTLRARVSQAIERSFLNRADRVIVSSPAFHVEHLLPRMGVPSERICLIENKVAPEQAERVTRKALAYGKPVRIAYFGKIRCARSVEMLTRLVQDHPGEFEVVLAGYADAIPQEAFDRFVALDGVDYRGSFSSVSELSELIADTHFVWAIDLKDAGANSSWLLPNRLYEAVASGIPVLTLADDACGQHAVQRRWGLTLHDMTPARVRDVLATLDADAYAQLREAVLGAPRTGYVDQGDIVRLLERLSVPRSNVAPV